MAKLSQPISLRVSPNLQGALERFHDAIGAETAPKVSHLIRMVLHRESALWQYSPYLVLSARHLILVAANGSLYYRNTERIELKTPRWRLPMSVLMKPEKREYYEGIYSKKKDPAASIRRHWLVNHFAAWLGGDTAQQPLDRHVDRLGIDAKTADLRVEQGQDTQITRETIVGLSDYVQRKSHIEDPRYRQADDRADVPVVLPTLKLDIRLLVDRGLYRDSPSTMDSAATACEFRNPELARLEEKAIWSEQTPFDWRNARFPEDAERSSLSKPDLPELRRSFAEFRRSLYELADSSVVAQDGKPVVPFAAARAELQGLREPERFLLGHLTWDYPCSGLAVCLSWNKPD